MIKLPFIFRNPNEEYITIPALKTFMKIHNISIPDDEEHVKETYLQSILTYGDSSSEKLEAVLSFFDNVISEGIKDIQIKKVHLPTNMEIIFNNDASIKSYIGTYVKQDPSHFVGSSFDDKFHIVKFGMGIDSLGKHINLVFARMLHQVDIWHGGFNAIEYPIIVDYYLDDGWQVLRYKPRSNLYYYHPEYTSTQEFVDARASVNITTLINEVEAEVNKIFSFDPADIRVGSHEIRNRLYRILDKYTHTPSEIQAMLDSNEKEIAQLAQNIASICRVSVSALHNITVDLKNLVEKFISINWPNKEIFINDREAYPIKLSATDEEESRVEQTAATVDDPLQSKEVFFDNKRMLCNQKLCDGLTLMWKRKTKTYYTESSFPVKLAEKSGFCALSFRKYTAEEDIENVLNSIIRA